MTEDAWQRRGRRAYIHDDDPTRSYLREPDEEASVCRIGRRSKQDAMITSSNFERKY